MNYLDIVKRAWNTTWQYKILWLFGLFAGAGAGGGSNWNSGGGGSGGSSGSGTGGASQQQLAEIAQRYLPVLIGIAVVLVLIGIVFFVLTFAAKGGLVHLVNEAEEKRPVRAADGWRVGFAHWGRVFLIDFIIGLPVLIVVVIFALVFGASLVGLIAGSAGSTSQSAANTGAILGGVGGMCCGLVFLVVAVFAYSIVFGTVGQLALRYAVLEERTALESLKQGWSDVWAKRGAIGMFFVMYATSIVYGVALSVLLIALVVPIVLMSIAGNVVGAGLVGLFAGLLAMLPAAIYGAFSGSAWTIFFRRMTGREPLAPAVPAYAGGYPPAPPAAPEGGFPPPPPADLAPQAPAPAADPWQAANGVPPVDTTPPAPHAPPAEPETPPAPPAPPAEPPVEGA